MTQFIKAPDLWKEQNYNAVIMGMLKLQAGQRFYCGDSGRSSIFVGVSPAGTIWAVHYVPNVGYDWEKFRKMRQTLAGLPQYVPPFLRDARGAA